MDTEQYQARWHIGSTDSDVHALRREVADVLGRWELPVDDELRFTFLLLLSELVTNAYLLSARPPERNHRGVGRHARRTAGGGDGGQSVGRQPRPAPGRPRPAPAPGLPTGRVRKGVVPGCGAGEGVGDAPHPAGPQGMGHGHAPE